MKNNIPAPVNVEEKYLHAIVLRLDALCHMMDSFIKAYAEEKGVATEKTTVKEKPAPKKRAAAKKPAAKKVKEE